MSEATIDGSTYNFIREVIDRRDNTWLQLDVCPSWQETGRCSKEDLCCHAHPPKNIEILDSNRVVACFDEVKKPTRCNRKDCKFFHPPDHLKNVVITNGKQNLRLRNELRQKLEATKSRGGVTGGLLMPGTGYPTGCPVNPAELVYPLVSHPPLPYFHMGSNSPGMSGWLHTMSAGQAGRSPQVILPGHQSGLATSGAGHMLLPDILPQQQLYQNIGVGGPGQTGPVMPPAANTAVVSSAANAHGYHSYDVVNGHGYVSGGHSLETVQAGTHEGALAIAREGIPSPPGEEKPAATQSSHSGRVPAGGKRRRHTQSPSVIDDKNGTVLGPYKRVVSPRNRSNAWPQHLPVPGYQTGMEAHRMRPQDLLGPQNVFPGIPVLPDLLSGGGIVPHGAGVTAHPYYMFYGNSLVGGLPQGDMARDSGASHQITTITSNRHSM